MKDKIVLLGGKGHLMINGVDHQVSVVISPIGELTFLITSLKTGLQTDYFMMDAISAFDLHEAQNAFYKGEFEAEMMDE